jgi:hypothetical protein
MDERLLGRDPALNHQLFDVGMIGAAKDQAVATKMIQAAVAAVRPAHLAGLQEQHHDGAVWILFVHETRCLDQHVRFIDA